MTQGEVEVVIRMLDTCAEPVQVEAKSAVGLSIPTPTPMPGLGETNAMYGSCAKAEGAGELRM